MGSIISKINDDYDDYLVLCEIVGEDAVDLYNGFYDHARKLTSKYVDQIAPNFRLLFKFCSGKEDREYIEYLEKKYWERL